MLICQEMDLIENIARSFEVDGKHIIVIKRDQRFYAYMNQCPHLGIHLEWEKDQFMDFENHFLQCSSHGALFQVEDGFCVSGPCIGQALIKVEIMLKNHNLYLKSDVE